jgi:multisubunit Na+/H+ antiporter MnhB subunit
MTKTKNISADIPTEKFDLKRLSWVLILILGAGSFYALTFLPSSSGPQPTFHVASRFMERGTQETGFSSHTLAVLADYRSFDLILLSFIFLIGTLMASLLCLTEKTPVRAGWVFLNSISILSVVMLLGVGLVCLKKGGNFLDYEVWSHFLGSSWSRARSAGSGVLLFSTCLAAFFGICLKVLLTWKEMRDDK